LIKIKEVMSIVENANKWKHDINYKVKPLLYEVTECFGGMYTCEPYKTKFLKVWKFSNPKSAKLSASKIKDMFFLYLKEEDFVGADLAKKFLKAGSEKNAIDEKCKLHFGKEYQEIKDHKSYSTLKDEFLLKQKSQREKNERR